MSYVFDIDGETVWSPALLAGQVYVGIVRLLEQIMDLPAGLSPVADDMVEFDRSEFSAFVDRLMKFGDDGRHPVLAETVAPIVAISLVMLNRSQPTGQESKVFPDRLQQAIDRLGLDMAR